MRTKQTGNKATPSTNGKAGATPKSSNAPAPASAAKSPAQAPELSEADRLKMKHWLDRSPNPFAITIIKKPDPPSKKRKRGDDLAEANRLGQHDLWEERLTVHYDIKPKDKWESLRRYKKFTVGSESIATGQCILVKADDIEDPKIDLAGQWKAKVLEVRALDSEHVYIRVAWLNRPEDLPTGRKPWHGKNELIPTNQMDVIDAMAVNGSLEVVHWDDHDEESLLPHDEQYFWRQTYDYANTKTFSKLNMICHDTKPQNPDEMIVQCSDEGCRKWLHTKCIAEKAVEQAVKGTPGKQNSKPEPKNANINENSSVVAKGVKGKFTSQVFLKGFPPDNPATNTEVVLTDAEGVQRGEEIHCLCCGKPIDD